MKKSFQKLRTISEMYWTDEDRRNAALAKTMEDLSLVGMQKLERMLKINANAHIIQCCGPITNGGLGSFEENIQELTKAIAFLIIKRDPVFNQLPFGKDMMRILNEELCIPASERKERNAIILEKFYDPLLKSGHIKELKFLHLWHTSEGTLYEHKKAKEYGIHINYLAQDFSVL